MTSDELPPKIYGRVQDEPTPQPPNPDPDIYMELKKGFQSAATYYRNTMLFQVPAPTYKPGYSKPDPDPYNDTSTVKTIAVNSMPLRRAIDDNYTQHENVVMLNLTVVSFVFNMLWEGIGRMNVSITDRLPSPTHHLLSVPNAVQIIQTAQNYLAVQDALDTLAIIGLLTNLF
jgi:hypothetical protein